MWLLSIVLQLTRVCSHCVYILNWISLDICKNGTAEGGGGKEREERREEKFWLVCKKNKLKSKKEKKRKRIIRQISLGDFEGPPHPTQILPLSPSFLLPSPLSHVCVWCVSMFKCIFACICTPVCKRTCTWRPGHDAEWLLPQSLST